MNPNNITEFKFSSTEIMLDTVYEHIVEQLKSSLKAHQQVSLLVSGGSTPGPLYNSLAHASLPWEKIHVGLVDERWVDTHHSASNEKLITDSLLSQQASPAFTGMKTSAKTATQGVNECEARYRCMPQHIACTLLGMGSDGHTASLFPYANGLQEAFSTENRCAAIYPKPSSVTGEFVERMSLTPNALLQSQRLILLITGKEKWDVYQAAKRSSEPLATPIGYFLQQTNTPIHVYWAP